MTNCYGVVRQRSLVPNPASRGRSPTAAPARRESGGSPRSTNLFASSTANVPWPRTLMTKGRSHMLLESLKDRRRAVPAEVAGHFGIKRHGVQVGQVIGRERAQHEAGARSTRRADRRVGISMRVIAPTPGG